MKKTYHIFIIALLLLIISQAIYGFDYGFELSNAAGIKKIEKLIINTDHKETMWLTLPLNDVNTMKLSIEGSFYGALPAPTEKFSYFINLDLFRFSITPAISNDIKISIDAGRIPIADSTGFVLNHLIDGTELHLSFPFGNIDFAVGYTGLLNVRSSSILISIDDSTDTLTEKIYGLGAKRIIGKLIVQIPQIIENIDFIAEGIGQYDLRKQFDSKWQELVNTAYGSIALNGPILNNLYYSLSGTLQTGVKEVKDEGKFSENSLIGSVRLDFFPSRGNLIFAQFVYSPPQNDFFSNYTPVSTVNPGILFPSSFTNLMRATAGWNFNPASAFNINIGANMFLNSSDTDTSKGIYNSSEFTGGVTYMATSDLRFRLDSTMFLPKSKDLQFQASLKAIIEL